MMWFSPDVTMKIYWYIHRINNENWVIQLNVKAYEIFEESKIKYD